jgi:hypothetical protein
LVIHWRYGELHETTQRKTSHALRQQGFLQAHYDLVVTELTLQRKNVYTLALELLQSADRLVHVVYTGVIEPRTTKDRLIRRRSKKDSKNRQT